MNNFQICKTCLHRKIDVSGKMYCGYNIEPDSLARCDEYSVDEMEKIRLEMQKAKASKTASGGIRFANYLIDIVGYFLLSILIGVFLGGLNLATGMDISWLNNDNHFTNFILSFFIRSSYFIFFEGVLGQTPGKMITGTKVVTLDGQKPGIEKIMTRTLCRFIPFNAFSFLSSDAVGWHDSFSKTRVVSK